jgi:hypothetical protein
MGACLGTRAGDSKGGVVTEGGVKKLGRKSVSDADTDTSFEGTYKLHEILGEDPSYLTRAMQTIINGYITIRHWSIQYCESSHQQAHT